MEQKVDYHIVPFETIMSMGEVFAKSGYFSDAQEQAQAVVKMLAGQEMGVGPFASMSGIHIIKGKPEVGAHLLAAVLKRSGKYDYRIKQPVKADAVTIEFFQLQQDGPKSMAASQTVWVSIGESTFTAADAKAAGTGNMQKYPRNMLFARAISNGVKWYCPDVSLAPLYSRGEIDQDANIVYEDEGGRWVDIEPEVVESEVVEVEESPEITTTGASGNGRPWDAKTLKTNLLRRAGQLREQGDSWLEPPQKGVQGYCTGQLNDILGDDDRRHTFLDYVFGDPSMKKRDRSDVQAMMDWLGGMAGMQVVTDEANRLVNSVVTEQAAGVLL